MEALEREIGTVFTVGRKNKKKLLVFEKETNTCDGCFFEAKNIIRTGLSLSCYTANRGECNKFVRKDEKAVIFKEVE